MDNIIWSYIEAIVKILGALFIDCVNKGINPRSFKTK